MEDYISLWLLWGDCSSCCPYPAVVQQLLLVVIFMFITAVHVIPNAADTPLTTLSPVNEPPSASLPKESSSKNHHSEHYSGNGRSAMNYFDDQYSNGDPMKYENYLKILLIPSVNSLLSEIPSITDSMDFCLCLELPYPRCDQLRTDNRGDTRGQVREIAAEWYRRSSNPNWEDVVDALFCHHHNHDAIQLAEKKGVDWRPLKSMWEKY